MTRKERFDSTSKKQGWAFIPRSNVRHYWINAGSVCNRWLGWGLDMNNLLSMTKLSPEDIANCKHCRNIVKAYNRRLTEQIIIKTMPIELS